MLPILQSTPSFVPNVVGMKPKLEFSIDSLVGKNCSSNDRSALSQCSSPQTWSPTRSTSPESLNYNLSLRIPQPIHPLLPNLPLQPPLLGPGIGLPSGIPLTSLIPASQAIIPPSLNPVLLSQIASVGAPSSPSPSLVKEYQFNPWLLSRSSRLFDPRTITGPEFPTFFMPFRKPKRIRTAFSPEQLLKLEQAFERNQYVVGLERKQLSRDLNLSETQVKVWFQNRRTKHKKEVQEEDPSSLSKEESEKDFNSPSENDKRDSQKEPSTSSQSEMNKNAMKILSLASGSVRYEFESTPDRFTSIENINKENAHLKNSTSISESHSNSLSDS